MLIEKHTREQYIYLAELAEKAQRYDEMVDAIKSAI